MMTWCTKIGNWEWHPVAEALETAGLWPIKEYIQQRSDTVKVQVAFWTIYELFKKVETMTVTSRFMWWW